MVASIGPNGERETSPFPLPLLYPLFGTIFLLPTLVLRFRSSTFLESTPEPRQDPRHRHSPRSVVKNPHKDFRAQRDGRVFEPFREIRGPFQLSYSRTFTKVALSTRRCVAVAPLMFPLTLVTHRLIPGAVDAVSCIVGYRLRHDLYPSTGDPALHDPFAPPFLLTIDPPLRFAAHL